MKYFPPQLVFILFSSQLFFFPAFESATTIVLPSVDPDIYFNCSSSADCGVNWSCTTTRQCFCPFGWFALLETVGNDGQVAYVCRQITCDDCDYYFGPSSRCTPGNGNSLCQCPAPAYLETVSDFGCKAPLGGPCKKDKHCGKGATCNSQANDTCSCPFGYFPDGKFNCKLAICSKDGDCHLNFGSESRCRFPVDPTSTAKVSAPFCACKDPVKYFESSTTAKCEKRTAKPQNCSQDSDCQSYSQCQSGVCTCKLLTVPDTTSDNNNGCTFFACINNSECSQLWPGAQCFHSVTDKTWRGTCIKLTNYASNVAVTAWIYLLLVCSAIAQPILISL